MCTRKGKFTIHLVGKTKAPRNTKECSVCVWFYVRKVDCDSTECLYWYPKLVSNFLYAKSSPARPTILIQLKMTMVFSVVLHN